MSSLSWERCRLAIRNGELSSGDFHGGYLRRLIKSTSWKRAKALEMKPKNETTLSCNAVVGEIESALILRCAWRLLSPFPTGKVTNWLRTITQ